MTETSRRAPPGWRLARRRLLAVALGAFAAFAAGEVALRILGLPSTRPFFQELKSRAHLAKLMCYDSNPSGVFDIDLRDPERRARYEGWFQPDELRHWTTDTPWAVLVQLNSLGFREREDTSRRGSPRVAIVGDSFTYGHGLPEAVCFPRRLEGLLRRRWPTAEVLNCGVGGLDLDRLAPVMRMVLERYSPDVLVYAYFLNDAALPTTPPPPGMPREDVDHVQPALDAEWRHAVNDGARFALGVRPAPWSRIGDAVVRLREQRRLLHATLAWYHDIHLASNFAPSGERLVDLDRRARERGCRFVIAVLPVILDVSGDYPLLDAHARVTSFAREHGIEALDMLPELRGDDDRTLMIHPHDRHPSPTYTRLVAEALARSLTTPR